MTDRPEPSPSLFFSTVTAYQRTAALQAAVDLDLFSAIGDTSKTADEVAELCQATPRGIRILSDFLCSMGFLQKDGNRYRLTVDSAAFLDRSSPLCLAGTLDFLLAPPITEPFKDLVSAVRNGGTTASDRGTIAPEHPVWIRFARAMAPLVRQPAEAIAKLIEVDQSRPAKVLDISASHGSFGIAFARKNPHASIVALDWAPVLEVARENAQAAGLSERFNTIEGNAFDVAMGDDYDVILVPNFLHHFNTSDCTVFLKSVHNALRAGGRVVIVDFVPNPDRISPPGVADFSLVMLSTTPEGDAYTFAEFEKMLMEAGFGNAALHPLPPSLHSAIIALKE